MITSIFNILSHFHYIMNRLEKLFSRITNTKPHINNFNWKNINFPPTQQDYQNFEINNSSTALNIFQMNDQQKISHFYKSEFDNSRKNKLIITRKQALCMCKEFTVFTKLITFIIRV